MKIASWNLNGILAAKQKGLVKTVSEIDADIFCFQEIKTTCQINLSGYYQFWYPSKRKGYSGTMVLTKVKPIKVSYGFGIDALDGEGRLICMDFTNVSVINVYVPNSQGSLTRRDYRTAWDVALREFIVSLARPVIICGDFNVARDYIDIYPENLRNPETVIGFQTEEREALEALLKTGLVDAFRRQYPTRTGCYTWWSNRLNKRLENRGWRLDYFLVSVELAESIRDVTHETEVMGSDHCPITLTIDLTANNVQMDDEALAAEWRSIDWEKAESDLFRWQQQLAKAAYARNSDRIVQLQKRIAYSFGCKALAVRHVSALGTTPGIDGVKWTTDAEKMRAAKSLTSKDYHAQPYRCIIVRDGDKERRIHIPTAYDKAMQVLYAYTLDPVSESLADRKSFAFRKGRSPFDAHSYIIRTFSGSDAPTWVVRADIKGCYDNISHKWLLRNIPMSRKVLEEFLNAGSFFGGKLFPTTEGISQGVTLSTILSNMVLDGMQKYIFERLHGSSYLIDYRDGDMVRFADDIIVGVRTKEQAEKVLEILTEFLAERGLTLHPEKTYISTIDNGFEFLSRWYQRQNGIVMATPSEKAVRHIEARLEKTILSYNGSQSGLIKAVNSVLSGWATYHRVSDCYEDFRHIDTVVQALLARKVRMLHPKRQWGHLVNQYWYTNSDGHHVFALPDNRAIHIIELQGLSCVKHRPVHSNYNPYFDEDYYESLQKKRAIQKRSEPKYRAIWNRQGGVCYYCGNPMLPEQDVVLVEMVLGEGQSVQNLAYIHKSCSYMELSDVCEVCDFGDGVDVLGVLSAVTEPVDDSDAPLRRLMDFFRTTDKSPLSLTFKKIEQIMGDLLEPDAYTDENFWYDERPDLLQQEGMTSISGAWLSQGYSVMRLHLEEKRVVFRKNAPDLLGLKIPEKLTTKKIPEAAVYEAREFFSYLIKKYGL